MTTTLTSPAAGPALTTPTSGVAVVIEGCSAVETHIDPIAMQDASCTSVSK